MATKIKLGNGNWGVKDGGTLAYNDENGIFKAIELASSRASGATYVAQSGLIADAEVGVPRIDWTNGVGELLLEPQSTNLITYSEDFTDASWVKSNGGTGVLPVVTSNFALSPDGSMNADRVQFDLGGGTTSADLSWLQFSYSSVLGNNYTSSIYLKLNSGSAVVFLCAESSSQNEITITDEWVRFDFTQTSASTTSRQFRIGLRGNLSVSDTADILVWGAQLEELSYPTSYIRTSGTTITRIADAVTGNSSLGQVINSSEGVLYAEMSALADIDSIRLLELNDNNSTNRVYIYFRNSSGVNPNRIFAFVVSGGSIIFSSIQTLPLSASVLDSNKFAIKWKLNDFALWINGVEVDTGTGVVPLNLSRISFSDYLGNLPFYGRIKDLRVYDTALTDAELTALTTL